jgi:prepilin-type processing-associated H-X9-DG protein
VIGASYNFNWYLIYKGGALPDSVTSSGISEKGNKLSSGDFVLFWDAEPFHTRNKGAFMTGEAKNNYLEVAFADGHVKPMKVDPFFTQYYDYSSIK